MKRIRYLSLLLMLLCGITAWAQNDDYNPTSPPDPGQILEYFRLTLTADPAEAASSLTGGGKYTEGTSVTLKTTAKTGWKFVNWTDESGETVTSPYSKKRGSETLTAHFEFDPNGPSDPGEIAQEVKYWLTLAVEEGGSASGGGRYKIGEKKTVTATAKDKYEFVGWFDSEGETLLATNSSYQVTMVEGGIALLAKFTYNPDSPIDPAEIKAAHKVILNVEEGGTASANPSQLIEGETTTIKATPKTGYDFDGWYRNGVFYTESEQFTYTMGSENAVFEAHFTFNPNDPSDPTTPEAKKYAFYLMNIIGKPGSTVKFPVYLTTHAIAKNMDFQLTFPSELVPKNVETPTLADEASGYTVTCTDGSDADEGETAYVYTLTTDGELPVGNVALMTFDIEIPESQETGKGYPVYINQITVNDAENAPKAAAAKHGRVSVYKLGDSNGDNVVDIKDKINAISYLLGDSPEVFIEEVGDVNDDKTITVTDATMVDGLIKPSGE